MVISVSVCTPVRRPVLLADAPILRVRMRFYRGGSGRASGVGCGRCVSMGGHILRPAARYLRYAHGRAQYLCPLARMLSRDRGVIVYAGTAVTSFPLPECSCPTTAELDCADVVEIAGFKAKVRVVENLLILLWFIFIITCWCWMRMDGNRGIGSAG